MKMIVKKIVENVLLFFSWPIYLTNKAKASIKRRNAAFTGREKLKKEELKKLFDPDNEWNSQDFHYFLGLFSAFRIASSLLRPTDCFNQELEFDYEPLQKGTEERFREDLTWFFLDFYSDGTTERIPELENLGKNWRTFSLLDFCKKIKSAMTCLEKKLEAQAHS